MAEYINLVSTTFKMNFIKKFYKQHKNENKLVKNKTSKKRKKKKRRNLQKERIKRNQSFQFPLP